jgi:probable addiction module antidote protein
MPKRTGDFGAWRLEKLSNPTNAAHYLNAALEDSPDVFLDAFRDVIQARKQVSEVAKEAGVTRESIYRSFSASGNPTLATLCSVLKVLELELKIEAGAENTAGGTSAPQSSRSRKVRKRRKTSLGQSRQLALDYDSVTFGTTTITASVPSLSAMMRSTTTTSSRLAPLEQRAFGAPYLPNTGVGDLGVLPFLSQKQTRDSSPAVV